MQRFQAFLAPEAGAFDAAEWGFDAAGEPFVDEDLAGLEPLGGAQGLIQVAGEDAGGQAVVGVVGQSPGLFRGVERRHGDDRPEHFLLEDGHGGRDVREHRGLHKVARQAVGRLAAADDARALGAGLGAQRQYAVALRGADQRGEVGGVLNGRHTGRQALTGGLLLKTFQ